MRDVIGNNLKVVEAHFQSEADDDIQAAVDLYTEDVVWEAPARQLVFTGKEAVAEHYRWLFAQMSNVRFENLRRFATESQVVDDSIVRFTLIGEGLWPFDVGTEIEMRLVHIFEIRDSKISREIAFEMPHAA